MGEGAGSALLVEDDAETREYLSALLAEVGLRVRAAANLDEARRLLPVDAYDLVVVDRMLPDGSGLDLARAIRAEHAEVPILFLTALQGVGQRVEGFEAGADDYVGKPFAPSELKARVSALLRRGARSRRRLQSGALLLDVDRQEVFVGDTEVPLTARELLVLEMLVTRKAVERDEMLETVWGNASAEASASLDVIVSRLRRKLTEHGLPGCIETMRGRGFRWRSP